MVTRRQFVIIAGMGACAGVAGTWTWLYLKPEEYIDSILAEAFGAKVRWASGHRARFMDATIGRSADSVGNPHSWRLRGAYSFDALHPYIAAISRTAVTELREKEQLFRRHVVTHFMIETDFDDSRSVYQQKIRYVQQWPIPCGNKYATL